MEEMRLIQELCSAVKRANEVEISPVKTQQQCCYGQAVDQGDDEFTFNDYDSEREAHLNNEIQEIRRLLDNILVLLTQRHGIKHF